MKNKVFIKIIIVVILILSLASSYINNLRLQSELGTTYFHLLASTDIKLKQTITYLKGENLSKEAIGDDLYVFSTINLTAAYTSRLGFLNLYTLIGDYYKYERIYTDKDYREDLIILLEKYQDALQIIFNEVQEYKTTHYIENRENGLWKNFYGKIYYDYFSQKPLDRIKYKTKAEEVFLTNFNE